MLFSNFHVNLFLYLLGPSYVHVNNFWITIKSLQNFYPSSISKLYFFPYVGLPLPDWLFLVDAHWAIFWWFSMIILKFHLLEKFCQCQCYYVFGYFYFSLPAHKYHLAPMAGILVYPLIFFSRLSNFFTLQYLSQNLVTVSSWVI